MRRSARGGAIYVVSVSVPEVALTTNEHVGLRAVALSTWCRCQTSVRGEGVVARGEARALL